MAISVQVESGTKSLWHSISCVLCGRDSYTYKLHAKSALLPKTLICIDGFFGNRLFMWLFAPARRKGRFCCIAMKKYFLREEIPETPILRDF